MTPEPAEDDHDVVAALLALQHRAERPASTGPDPSGAPEAAWRRGRLAALGLLPRFPRG